MKYLMIVGDGMADLPQAALQGHTPISYLSESGALPGMCRMASGEVGRALTCPDGVPPGSDVAFLSLLGQDPKTCYTGRSPLEAAGEGVLLQPGETSLRVNLITVRDGRMFNYSGGGIGGEDARQVASDLLRDAAFARLMADAGMRIHVTDTFRQVAVLPTGDAPYELTPAHDISGQRIADYAPKGEKADVLAALQARARDVLAIHPINQRREQAGLLPANGIWFWGAGVAATLRSFPRAYGRTGAVVTAVPLVRGVARLSGLDAERVPGATGGLDTDYEKKVECAIKLFETHDFVLLHTEAPDDLSHLGDLDGKLESIRRMDARLVLPMLAYLDACGDRYRALVLPDHYTLLSTQTHDGTPIPYALYDGETPYAPRAYSESLCRNQPCLPTGRALLERLLGV